MDTDHIADLVVKYAGQLAGGTFVLGLIVGVAAVLFVLWLRRVVAEYRRGQQFKIHRHTPFGI